MKTAIKSRRRYSDFFDFAPVGYFTFSRHGHIQKVNPGGTLLLGADKQSLLNKPLAHFLSPNSAKIFEQHIQQLWDTGQIKNCDLKLINGNQETSWIQLESVAVPNGDGGPDRCSNCSNPHLWNPVYT